MLLEDDARRRTNRYQACFWAVLSIAMTIGLASLSSGVWEVIAGSRLLGYAVGLGGIILILIMTQALTLLFPPKQPFRYLRE